MCENQLSSASPNIVVGANGLVLNGSANNSPAGNAHNFQSILQSQPSSTPLNSVGNAMGLSTQQLQQQFHNQNFGGGGGMMEHHHHQSQQQQQGRQIQQHSFSGLQHHSLFDNQSQQHSSHHNTLSLSFNSHHLQQQQQQQANMGFGGLHGMNTHNNLGMGNYNVGNNAFNSSPRAAVAAALNHYFNRQTHHHHNKNNNNGRMTSNQQQSSGFILPRSNISGCNHSFPTQQSSQLQQNVNASTVPWMDSTATNSPAALIPQNTPSCFNTFTQNNGSSICLPARPQLILILPAPQRIPALPPRVYHQPNTDPNALPDGLEILWRELPPDCKKLMAPQDVPDAAKLRGYFTVRELLSLKRQLLARYETVPQRLRSTPIRITKGCSSSTAAKEVVKKGTKRGRKEPKVASVVALAQKENEQQQALQQPSQSTAMALACKPPQPEIKKSFPEIQEIENETNSKSLDGEIMIDLNGLKRDDNKVQAGDGNNDAIIATVFLQQRPREGEPEETQQNEVPSPGCGGTGAGGGKTIVSSSNGKSVNKLAGGPLYLHPLTLVLKMLKIGTFNIRSFTLTNPNKIKIVFSTQRITYECQLPTIYQDNNRAGPQPTRKVLIMEYGFDQIQSLHFKSDTLYVKVGGSPALSISFAPAPDEEVLSPSSVSQEDQVFLEHVEKGSLRVTLTPYHEIHVLNEQALQLLQSQMREFPKLRNIFI